MIPERLTSARVRSWIRPRATDAHKGSNGHVLVIAGSRGMSGAAALAARGALRAGAGLVTVATTISERPLVASLVPEAMTVGLSESADGRAAAEASSQVAAVLSSRHYDVIAIGPGLGVSPDVRKLILGVLGESQRPVLLDADGLNNLTAVELPTQRPLIVTPHPGEFERFFGVKPESRLSAIATTAQQYRLICVLKGAGTLISDGHLLYQNPTGNPAMATGGMGDVLTGVIAGLWAQRLGALEAATAGVYLHGLAGDLAAESDRGLLASDVAATLPKAFRKIGLRP